MFQLKAWITFAFKVFSFSLKKKKEEGFYVSSNPFDSTLNRNALLVLASLSVVPCNL